MIRSFQEENRPRDWIEAQIAEMRRSSLELERRFSAEEEARIEAVVQCEVDRILSMITGLGRTRDNPRTVPEMFAASLPTLIRMSLWVRCAPMQWLLFTALTYWLLGFVL